MSGDEEEILQEILKWLKFMGRQEARDVVESALSYDDEEKERAARITYQLTNGKNSTKDIARHISFSYRWVSSRHQEWATQGIVEKDGVQSPYEHILTLDELGIESPEIPDLTNE